MKKMSFITATRQSVQKVATLPFESGQRKSKDLPRVGLLANLYLRVKGTLTVTPNTGTATLKTKNYGKPYGLIERLQLTANSGTDIVNVSGLGLYLRNLIADDSKMDVLAANMPEAVSGNPVFQFGTASGANDVQFTLKVPVVINERDPVGLILLQNGETLMDLGLTWANPSNLFTLTGNAEIAFTGNAHVTMEYFEVPLNAEDYPDLSIAHTILEDSISVDGVGDLNYVIPRGNIYQRVIHRLLLNDVPAGFEDVERMTLRYNQSNHPYVIDGLDQLALQRDRYKRDLAKGVYVWDWAFQGQAGFGGNRDLVNSRAITDFQSIIKIASGATLGTNNNRLLNVREQLVPLQ
jgi:hypothetical protein